ncbi:MAG: GNAT family N-acetyltransferase [Defluviitaleaceae bacterium]|nr:GNAT family N-acetyltransferase [Defluviitaleaceae bacterium]
MKNITIRPMGPEEIDKMASLISMGYYDDIFFKWVVERDEDRHKIVTDYYKVYLNAKGRLAYVAEAPSGEIMGASVWLPHDTEPRVYDDINAAAGIYADRFQAVADWSHLSEPPMTPFYQLVGFATVKEAQGKGVGAAMLKYHLDAMDGLGIPTYLEASTPYHGKGVYAKFGYQPVGELMVFTDTAVLYPLWRPARKKQKVDFGGYSWCVLEERNDCMLLLSEKVIEHGKYHDTFENITWSTSSVRRYLNNELCGSFKPEEQAQILGAVDKIFLLSVEEVVQYFGDSGQLKNPTVNFYIDDIYNDARKATMPGEIPSRWLLRTPGSSNNLVAVVTVDGRICVTGDFVNRASTELFNVGIRPAMWVKKEGIALL